MTEADEHTYAAQWARTSGARPTDADSTRVRKMSNEGRIGKRNNRTPHPRPHS